MKKLLAVLLAIMMLCSLIPFSGIVSAAASVTLTVGTAYASGSGKTVYVPVSLSAYTNGYGGVQITNVTYDTSALTFVGFVSYSEATQPLDTNGFTDGTYATNGKALSYMIAPSSTTQAAKADGGILAYIKFTTAKAISSNVSVSVTVKEILTYTKGSSDKWVAWEKASVSVTAGKVAPDTTKPTASMSTTNNVAASQTVTLTMGDTTKLIGYYYGTSSTYSSNTFTTTSATSATKTVYSAGTYYLTTKDAAGNVSSTASLTFYKTTLNANGGSVSLSAIVNASGKSVTLPTPTRTNYIFKGWNTSSTATTGSTSITVNGTKTYYAIWSDAKIKAAEVDDLIAAIGSSITLSVESKITAARSGYNALSDEAKGYVTKLSTLTSAESALATLKSNVSAVQTDITNIGTVSLSNTVIDKAKTARTSYNALSTTELKNAVSNYSTLTSAESKLGELLSTKISGIGTVTLSDETVIADCEAFYKRFNSQMQNKVTNYSTLTAARTELTRLQGLVSAVETDITNIGTVSLTNAIIDKVKTARTNYNALSTTELKNAVSNYSTLTAAEAKLGELLSTKISGIGTVTLSDATLIADCEAFYKRFNSQMQSKVTNYATLTAARTELTRLQGLVSAVETDITNIGTVSLTNAIIDKVKTARTNYNALSTTELKNAVSNYSTLTSAEAKLGELLSTKISGIGTVTLSDATVIADCEAFYSRFNSQMKDKVTNYSTLTDARTELTRLQGLVTSVETDITNIGTVSLTNAIIDKVKTARTNYNALSTTELKNAVSNYSTLTAAEAKLGELIFNKIGTIGTVTLSDESLITSCRAFYNRCNTTIRNKVTNLATLEAAETRLAELKDANTAAASVDALIEKIGTVTLDKEDEITAARSAYDALNADGESFVTKLSTLTAAETRLAALKSAKTAAANVDTLIGKIGTVTLDKEDEITAARSAYDALNADGESFVTKLSTLTAAESRLAELKSAKTAAANVDTLIGKIGTVTLDKEDEITAARTAYDALNTDGESFVTKLSTLTAAETRLAALKAAKTAAANVDTLIGKIGTVTLNSEVAITAARNAYTDLNTDGESFVTKLATLEAAEASYAKLVAYKDAVNALLADGKVTTGELESARFTAASEAYSALNSTEKNAVEEYKTIYDETYNAFTVAKKINNIGDVTLESGDVIDAARSAYNALNDTEKSYIKGYYTTLQEAETLYADLVAADTVVSKIDAIGTVTLSSESKIVAARNAYNALTDAQKEYVTNLSTLTAAEAALEALKNDQSDVDEVVSKINAIGDVTLNSESKITAARNAYDALSDSKKDLVTNIATLEAAETSYAKLITYKEAVEALLADGKVTTGELEKGRFTAASEAYAVLNKSEKSAVAEFKTIYDETYNAYNVAVKINKIGDVTLESGNVIDTARDAYDALNDTEKSYIKDYYKTLQEAEALYADLLAADEVVAKINAIGSVYGDSEAAISAARDAYESLTDEQKQFVGNLEVLDAAEERFELLQNLGDLSNDGSTDQIDALYILQFSVNKISLSEEQALRADVNGDGVVNQIDALYILHLSVGKITTLPGTQRPNA